MRLGLSQQTLADLAGVTRGYIANIELGRANPTLDCTMAIARALGLELELVVRSPITSDDRRQRDLVHARCSGYVDRRLRSHGWETAREVEVVHGRSHGWIDLLAFEPTSGTLLVIEIKTWLDDVGAIERQLAWYERSGWGIAQSLGWHPRRSLSWLLVLATEEVDASLRATRSLIDRSFPRRAGAMAADLLAQDRLGPVPRGLALIDPSSRRRQWLIRARIDGRRSQAPYNDYADAARQFTTASHRSHQARIAHS